MTVTELLTDTINKIYHLKGSQLQEANQIISKLLESAPKKKKRVGGKYKGQFIMKDNFDDPLPKSHKQNMKDLPCSTRGRLQQTPLRLDCTRCVQRVAFSLSGVSRREPRVEYPKIQEGIASCLSLKTSPIMEII